MTKKASLSLLKEQKTKELLKRLIYDFARPYKIILCAGLFCMAMTALMSVGTAKLIEPIINEIFLNKRSDMLMPVTVTIFLVFLIKGLASYGESIACAYVSQRIVVDIQKKMFKQVIFCPMSFFNKTLVGDLVARFTNDITKLNNTVTGTLTSIGKDSFLLIGFVIFMFYQDWKLALFSFFVVPVAISPVIRLGRRMRRASTSIQEQTAVFLSYLTQAFQGIRLIKSYQMEPHQLNKTNEIVEDIFEKSFRASKIRSASHPIMEFLGGVAIAAVVAYGGSQVISGQQNPGTFFSFITALLMTYEPIKRLANLSTNLQEQLAAVERIFNFLDLKPQLDSQMILSKIPVIQGEIVFNQVTFGYENQTILKTLTLKIPAQKTIALVGASGAGKSTILNLIPRFYEIIQGSIEIDGINIQHYPLEFLRKQISFVGQDSILFDDSIRANIAYGKKEATNEEIYKAAQAAAAHEFIIDLPLKYETRVGEKGLKLSGGQRQRLSLAQALLKDAPILLLDEPTSALDSISEQKIQRALQTLMKNKTTLIIAHRLSTIMHADIIFVINKGQIVGMGKHSDLIQENLYYRNFYEKQFKQS